LLFRLGLDASPRKGLRMSQIEARLFGGLELSHDGREELVVNGRKTRALFGFLLVEADRWHPRDRLTGLFWGDRAETQARNSLNQALYEIRRLETASGVSLIERETDRIRLKSDSIDSDLCRFEARIGNDPVRAKELRSGALLEGYDTTTPEFADWLNSKRDQLQSIWSAALRNLVASELEGSASDIGIAAARQLIDLDPLDEDARRSLMLLLARTGHRAEAIRQYKVCANVLNDELGIEPETATREIWEQIQRSEPLAVRPDTAAADESQKLIDTLPPEKRPIIAVFPIENLSDDPDSTFFAEGLSEDLIFELGKFRWFAVLAHASTFQLRGKEVDPATAYRMFGATHAVAGRMRRSRDGMRLSVELSDCRTGEQLWVNRYNVRTEDFLDVEDDVARGIAAAIEPSLDLSEMRRAINRSVASLTAYELTQRGNWHLNHKTNSDPLSKALTCFEQATSIDPTYAAPLAGLAYAKFCGAYYGPIGSYRSQLQDSLEIATRALELEPENLRALHVLGLANAFLGHQEAALGALRRAIEVCPSFAPAYSGMAFAFDFDGSFPDALEAADQTIRLRPHDPLLYRCTIAKAIAAYQLGDYEMTDRVARDSRRSDSSYSLSNALLIASLGQQGRAVEAERIIQEFRSAQPHFDLVQVVRTMFPFSNPMHGENLADGLLRAGWGE
jgi:DNA-binding SARP family transcriptional activator/TolB-like protein